MQAHVIRVTDIGWKARRLVDGASGASVIATLSRSLYLEVAGEVVWLGPPGSTLHGRAIVARDLPQVEGATWIETSFDLRGAREWRPPALAPSVTPEILVDEGRRLAGMVDRLGRPEGFGALLAGRRPTFPLDHATEDARSFLDACARDDAPAAAAIGERLLGLGPGLTPAGDDLIGGAFFGLMTWGASNGPPKPPDARRAPAQPRRSSKYSDRFLVSWGASNGPPKPPDARRAPAQPRRSSNGAWREAGAMIRARAPERTHRISAVLLGDLLDGDAYAPLHDLALALARGDARAGVDAAARLVRIGHSSGWDMLAGFLGALGALPGP